MPGLFVVAPLHVRDLLLRGLVTQPCFLVEVFPGLLVVVPSQVRYLLFRGLVMQPCFLIFVLGSGILWGLVCDGRGTFDGILPNVSRPLVFRAGKADVPSGWGNCRPCLLGEAAVMS